MIATCTVTHDFDRFDTIQDRVRKAVFTAGIFNPDTGAKEVRSTREFGPLLDAKFATAQLIGPA